MDNDNFLWPNVRRSLFDMEGSSKDSYTKCFTDHAGFGYAGVSLYYKEAADIIVKAKEMGIDRCYPDGLFMPVVYLYRHSLELKLKSLLNQIIIYGYIEKVQEDDKILGGHNIIKLWNRIKPALIEQEPKVDKKSLNNVEFLLSDFHKVDKSGQALRYSTLKNGNDVKENYPKIIRLELIKKAFDEMYNLLEGCSIHFEELSQFYE